MATDDDCHFAIIPVTSDFQGAHGAPQGAVDLCRHSYALPLLLALLGAGDMEAMWRTPLPSLRKQMDMRSSQKRNSIVPHQMALC